MVSRRMWPVGFVGIAGLWISAPVNAGPAPPPPPEAQQDAAPAQPQQGQPQQGQPQQGQPQPTAPAETPRAGGAPPPPGGPSVGVGASARAEDAPADLTGTWTYSRRRASPEPRYTRPPAERAAPHPKGFYSGVSIDGNQVPPSAPDKLGSKPVLLTWTGFERIDGGSQIYFQLSADVAFAVDETPGRIVIRMPNTRVNVRNNLRGLDLRFFDTPARGVTLKRKGRDLIATIELKKTTTAVIEQVEGQGGYRMLVVRFGEAKPEGMDDPPVRR